MTLKPIYYDADKTDIWRQLVHDRQARIEYAAVQRMPHLVELQPHTGRCAIVGSAPSIGNHLDEIAKFNGYDLIISLNGAHNYLIERGIIPRIHILFEIDLKQVEESTGGPPHREVYYYVCSHCDQRIFKQLRHHRRVLWHCFDEPPEYQHFILNKFPGEFMVGGGFVTFFRAINIGSILGFRQFELFGCDCSFEGERSHCEGYQNEKEVIMAVAAGTKESHRIFNTTPSLSFLASEIMRFCATNQRGINLRVHGDSLLRHMHQMEYPEVYQEGTQA